MIRMAIVHHSAINSHRLRVELSKITGYQVVWVAQTIAEALQKCKGSQPSLLFIDLEVIKQEKPLLPQMLKNVPWVSIIMASNQKLQEAVIFEAMGQGATDVINSEFLEYEEDFHFGFQLLLQKIRVISGLLGRSGDRAVEKMSKQPDPRIKHSPVPPLVLIGSSTGGPTALVKLIKGFPKKINFAIVIVQHVDEEFAESLARWLEHQTALPAELATDGSPPQAGKILLAGENKHLLMTHWGVFHYSNFPEGKTYKPSIDEFFKSVLKHWPHKAIAILLTGMGDDGAEGLKALHDAGWFTIAEDQKTCVVYGMPKAAIELKGVSAVLPIDQMAHKILNIFDEEWKYLF